jgi:signal transduction histidine kinase
LTSPTQQPRLLRDERSGIGLGLAISRDLARAMGADIRLASIVGQGTTVTVDLRRA